MALRSGRAQIEHALPTTTTTNRDNRHRNRVEHDGYRTRYRANRDVCAGLRRRVSASSYPQATAPAWLPLEA